MSKKSYLPISIFQEEKKNIHFDSLMEQAKNVLREQSGDLWTDVTTHDPGITMLEALAYNISDLSYRHLLPLVDLLTPAGGGGGAPLFPHGFEPEQMLTTSPITADDYRKGILDLYCKSHDSRWCYYFNNVEVLKVEGDERYRYFYDIDKKEFSFNATSANGVYTLYLNGSYHIRVKPNYLIRDLNIDSAELRQRLDEYLAVNRNLCEQFSTTEVFDFPAENNNNQPLVMSILANDMASDDNVNLLFLEVFMAAQQILYPTGERLQKIDLSETDYSGPRPEKGWIVNLPPSNFGDVQLSASLVKQKIESFSWVDNVSKISFDIDNTIWIQSLKHRMDTFWSNSSSLIIVIKKMMDQVTIKRGEKILLGEADKIYELLKQLQQTTHLPDERFPSGNYRKTGRYYPASDLLPAMYDLQEREPATQTRQLHQFLLPFEQLLADGCAQLASLSSLLDFAPFSGQPIWGHQWPFAQDTPNNDVHKEYKEAASKADIKSQDENSQQIALANYLQSYFGLTKNKNFGFSEDSEFLTVQRAFLSKLPEIGYARTAIHIGRISSLQRRVAARLGIGSMLFGDMTSTNLRKLPFYIIEHPLLMPRVPSGDFVSTQPVMQVDVASSPKRLVITTAMTLTDKLQRGQLVDLLLDGEQGETLSAVMVAEVQGRTFTLYIDEHQQLRLRLEKVVEIGAKLMWRTSNLWLKDMQYRWVLGDGEDGSQRKIRIVTADDQPWPPMVLKNDKLSLERVYTRGTRAATFSAQVEHVDAIKGEAVITLDDSNGFDPAARYRWSISHSASQTLDRFSFTLSFVFKRSLIMQGEPSPTALDEREMRIKRIVQEEIPAHLRARVLWLSDSQFEEFAATYVSWQNSDTRLGSDAYNLLRMLSIGMLPMTSLGIGVMRIATDEEFDNLPSNEPDRQQYIESHGLFFVPRTDVVAKLSK